MIKQFKYTQSADAETTLNNFVEFLRVYTRNAVGYPPATDFDYKRLHPFFDFMLNNIGDPYIDSPYIAHTKAMEIEVIDFFASLFRSPKNDYWGYVTAGGTEGNIYALYLARKHYPKASVYYSDASHYSIDKALSMLRMNGFKVATSSSEEINYDNLFKQLVANSASEAIVVANIGTTMAEAKDNVRKIKNVLQKAGVARYYIHCDGALAGVPAALLKPKHPFDFADGADSISISGHKFIGSPVPCGIIITRKKYIKGTDKPIDYIETPDTTIMGSRSGHAPLFMWYAIKKWGIDGFRKRAIRSVELAQYAKQQLQNLGWQVQLNANAMTLLIKSPSPAISKKWQLASQNGWSHVICMPGISKQQINDFIKDLSKEQTASA